MLGRGTVAERERSFEVVGYVFPMSYYSLSKAKLDGERGVNGKPRVFPPVFCSGVEW